MLINLKYAALAVMLCVLPYMAQSQINGVVTDQNNAPLGGAHVVLNGSERAVYTNFDGGFEFGNLKPAKYRISVSYIGYQTHYDTLEAGRNAENLKISLEPSLFLTDEVVVSATRLSLRAPATFVNIEKREIEKLNLGQDLPMLLNYTPSLVATSDAGAGVGYTSMRIRGSDQTRINITVNGIPINDPESQGVFWVNMPDISSSLSSMQIQRGLGTSTNGSGAFGASINMETNVIEQDAGGEISNSFGSFNTRKHTVQFNSGRLKDGFAIEGRLSEIASDGYIDRASSQLRSYYLSGGYYGEKTVVKALTFSGKERTYQSWYGTPQSRLENDVDGMLTHAANEGYSQAQTENLLNSGRTYNYYTYENQIDDYHQTHYQLHFIQSLAPDLKLTMAGHYTKGQGYFEEYKPSAKFADYGKPDAIIGLDTISRSDIIRRRWLDNDFYGGTFSLNYQNNNHNITLGGGAHIYRGNHFGEIVWSEVSTEIDHLEEYYRNIGDKDDFSIYGKWDYSLEKWTFMADLQFRSVHYVTNGIDNDQLNIDVDEQFLFLNPKIGARYNLNSKSSIYGYAGRGNREPVRNDFVDAPQGTTPLAETLNNIEIGYAYLDDKLQLNLNGFLMDYENQLVLTGELNDVGSSVRRNVDKSYRAGIEIDATYMFLKELGLNANAAFSRNKIENFNEVIYNYGGDDVGIITKNYADVDISFSPAVVASGALIVKPFDNFEINLISKYVGKQYLDNTGSNDRSIDAYWVSDTRIGYGIDDLLFDRIEFNLLINNIFNAMYASNGYTYSYAYGSDLTTENFYYPQAGTNFLIGLNLIF